MTPNLNFDCLNQIFKFIIEDDGDDNPTLLYPFALVNRIWCQTAIPILWSNPWKLRKVDANLPLKRNVLIKTYFTCLYQESREILVNENFFHKLFSTTSDNYSSSQITTKKFVKKNDDDGNKNSFNNIQNRPIFDYAKFLRHLKLNSLAFAIKFWTKFNLSNSRRETIHYDVLVEMINYLLIKSSRLITLDIRYCDGENYQSLQILANLLKKSDKRIIENLLKLKTFEYNGNVSELRQIFKILLISSHKIERIPIYIDTWTDDLMRLIKVQENLLEVTITRDSTDHWKRINLEEEVAMANTIIKTMGGTDLITCLMLKDIYIPFNHLSLFENLKELYLKSFYFPTNSEEYWESLPETFLPNLQKFHFELRAPDAKLYLDLITKFIRNNSRELSQIIIKGGEYGEYVVKHYLTKDLLITMSNYCQNLTVYEGPIGSSERKELKGFLKSCKKISSLHLHSTKKYFEQYENFDDLLNEISQIIPEKLTTLIISGNWIINSNSLETFLKSREILSSRRKISIYLDSLVKYEGKFRNICSKYQKKGIVEKYGDF